MRKYVQDGDVGCGPPGSLTWHIAAVAELEDRSAYVKEVFASLSDEDKLAFTLHLIENPYEPDSDGDS